MSDKAWKGQGDMENVEEEGMIDRLTLTDLLINYVNITSER